MEEKKKQSNIISNILLLLCVAVFLFSAWKLIGYFTEYRKGEEAYESITDKVVVMPSTELDGQNPETEIEKEPVLPVIDWEALSDMNEDLIGWLYIPDTIISYPIVHGTDNSYYLTHTFDHKTNNCGSIFMDMSNQGDYSSDNTILHGHNMKTGKMFGSLRKYESREYWETHPYIYIITEEEIMKYHIFSSERTAAASDVYTLEFGSSDSFASYLKKRKACSYYDTGVEVTAEDHLLTLSTCTSDTEEGRRVVQAKLVEVKEKTHE